jgi:hypothetical protein
MSSSFATAAVFADALHRVSTCTAKNLNNRNGNNNRRFGRAIA